MLKILQARLQQYVNCELPDVRAGFRKGRKPRDQIANICWIIEKAREFQKKTCISALLTMPKPLTVWITTNCGKFWKRWEYQTTWPASWETCMQVRKQQLELDMEQQIGSKSDKECVKAVYCHPAYLTSMHQFLCRVHNEKSWAGRSTSWNQDCGRNINNLRYADDTTLTAESEEELKSLLRKVKEENEKVGLKLNIQKNKIMVSGPITSWQIDGETVETVSDFIFLGSKITADGDCSHEIKRRFLLGRKVRQHIKKQRRYFAKKGLSSQSYQRRRWHPTPVLLLGKFHG